MKKSLLTLALVLPLTLFAADMDANGIVTKESHVDVKTTIDRIEMMVKKKGLTFFNRINHKKNAKNASGPDLDDAELIIFGNPKAGLKLMTKDPKAGLDLPLKMLAYKAKDGKVYLSYRDVKFYEKIYNIEKCKVQNKMSGLLNKFSNKAILSTEDFTAMIKEKELKPKILSK
ncbi:MAG: DUF302 domain-containing protein [Campylobacterota bacterium]|nr:DUF302 domain-containing protein [Campylobacterota bacterium]